MFLLFFHTHRSIGYRRFSYGFLSAVDAGNLFLSGLLNGSIEKPYCKKTYNEGDDNNLQKQNEYDMMSMSDWLMSVAVSAFSHCGD